MGHGVVDIEKNDGALATLLTRIMQSGLRPVRTPTRAERLDASSDGGRRGGRVVGRAVGKSLLAGRGRQEAVGLEQRASTRASTASSVYCAVRISVTTSNCTAPMQA